MSLVSMKPEEKARLAKAVGQVPGRGCYIAVGTKMMEVAAITGAKAPKSARSASFSVARQMKPHAPQVNDWMHGLMMVAVDELLDGAGSEETEPDAEQAAPSSLSVTPAPARPPRIPVGELDVEELREQVEKHREREIWLERERNGFKARVELLERQIDRMKQDENGTTRVGTEALMLVEKFLIGDEEMTVTDYRNAARLVVRHR